MDDNDHVMMTVRVKRSLKERFTDARRRRDIASGPFFSGVMESFVAGTHVNLEALRPEIRQLLEAERERHQFSSMQPVIEMIVGQWGRTKA